MKKLISMVLACSMIFTMGINAFASNNTETTQTTKTETVMVELENGKVIPVEVTETFIPARQSRASEDGPDVGSSYLYEFRISNEDIKDYLDWGAVALGTVGAVAAPKIITAVATLAKVTVSDMIKNAALVFLSGAATKVYNDIADSVLRYAPNGYEIEVGFSYQKAYTNAAGTDVYGWDYSYYNLLTY